MSEDENEKRDRAIRAVTGQEPEDSERQEWSRKASEASVAVWKRLRRPISTDDVKPVLPPIPEGADPRIMTACFPRKQWKRVGFTASRDPACNSRPKALWQPLGETEEVSA